MCKSIHKTLLEKGKYKLNVVLFFVCSFLKYTYSFPSTHHHNTWLEEAWRHHSASLHELSLLQNLTILVRYHPLSPDHLFL